MSNKAMTWAIECRVKGSHKLVLILLADCHNGSTGACFPSQRWIGEKGGLAKSTIQSVLNDLEEWGFITRQTQALGRGKGSKTDFVLHLDIFDPQNIGPQNTDVRTPDSDDLEAQNSGPENKDEPEEEPEGTGNAQARDVFDHYNRTATAVGWVVHARLTDAIKSPLNARIKDYGADQVKRFIEALTELEWTYRGFRDKPDFRASLTYITRPRTFAEHFDKLVTSQPERDLLTGADSPEREWPLDLEGAFNALERELVNGATRPAWIGGRYGYPMDPRCPDAKYPAGLYALFPKIQKWEAVS